MSWIDGGWVSFSAAEVAEARREARREALEEAARVCDKYAADYEGWAGGNDVAEGLAENIRALIDQEPSSPAPR